MPCMLFPLSGFSCLFCVFSLLTFPFLLLAAPAACVVCILVLFLSVFLYCFVYFSVICVVYVLVCVIICL